MYWNFFFNKVSGLSPAILVKKKTPKHVLLCKFCEIFNPLRSNFTKWPNTLKQFVGNLATNCLSVFGHFVGLALKGLRTPVLQNTFVELLLVTGKIKGFSSKLGKISHEKNSQQKLI